MAVPCLHQREGSAGWIVERLHEAVGHLLSVYPSVQWNGQSIGKQRRRARLPNRARRGGWNLTKVSGILDTWWRSGERTCSTAGWTA